MAKAFFSRSHLAFAFVGTGLLLVGPSSSSTPDGGVVAIPSGEQVASTRFRSALLRLEAGDRGGLADLERISEDEDGGWFRKAARVRLAAADLADGRPHVVLQRLAGGISSPSDLWAVTETLRASALVRLDRLEEASEILDPLVRREQHPILAEQLAIQILDPGSRELPPGFRRRLGDALADHGLSDDVRGRALLGTLLPLLRESDPTAYERRLRETLIRAPVSVLRTKAIPRDARTSHDLLLAGSGLGAPERLARATVFAKVNEPAAALAELDRIAGRASGETGAAIVALRADLLADAGRWEEASLLAATSDVPEAVSQRIELARAVAQLHKPAPLPASAVSLSKKGTSKKGKGRKAAVAKGRASGSDAKRRLAAIASAHKGPAHEEAQRRLAALDRDDVVPAVRQSALETLFRDAWNEEDLGRALRHFTKKESLFPRSSIGREEIWQRGFQKFVSRDHLDALPYLDALGKAGEPSTSRKGRYWAARARLKAGQLDVGVRELERLANSPAVDFYARHAARRLAELGHDVRTPDWNLAPARPVPAGSVPAYSELFSNLGLPEQALVELPDRADLPAGARIRRAELLARTGQRERAMSVVKSIAPDIQSAAVSELPENELRIFYPLAFTDQLRKSAEKYDLPLASLVGLVRQESGFRTQVRSGAGALGLMQIMPATARILGRQMFGKDVAPHQLGDAELAIGMGSYYLRDLIDRLGGELELALAGYNCGPGRVAAVKRRIPDGDVDVWVEALPFAETRDYVKKIVLYSSVYRKLYPEIAEPQPKS